MIASEVTKGVAMVAMNTGVPTVFGVLTTDSVEQAIDRAGTKMGNKGWEAAGALLELGDRHRNLCKTSRVGGPAREVGGSGGDVASKASRRSPSDHGRAK
jgi:hypothetical protein